VESFGQEVPMRFLLIAGVLIAATGGCNRKQAPQQAMAPGKVFAAWEPIDPQFNGCEGG
jgi:hypothetical protein